MPWLTAHIDKLSLNQHIIEVYVAFIVNDEVYQLFDWVIHFFAKSI
jgi:hypothetical protein